MKKYFNRIKVAILAAFALVGSVIQTAIERAAAAPSGLGMRLKQGGFVLLGKSYMGYASGTIVELPASTEAALVASGQATVSAGPPTSGAVSTTANSGAVGIAAGQSSIVITNPNISVQSLVWACVAQAAADATLLRIERIVPGAGLVTIYGTAAATAAVTVDWAILNPNGSLSNPQ